MRAHQMSLSSILVFYFLNLLGKRKFKKKSLYYEKLRIKTFVTRFGDC